MRTRTAAAKGPCSHHRKPNDEWLHAACVRRRNGPFRYEPDSERILLALR
jgi:hypothetical protein